MLLSQLNGSPKKRANNTEIQHKLQMTYTKVAAHFFANLVFDELPSHDLVLRFSAGCRQGILSFESHQSFAMVCSKTLLSISK
jgi:hypothetical protein